MKTSYSILVVLLLAGCSDSSELKEFGEKIGGIGHTITDFRDTGVVVCPSNTIDELAQSAREGEVLQCPDGQGKVMPKEQVEQNLSFLEGLKMRQFTLAGCREVACGNGKTGWLPSAFCGGC